MSVLDEFKRILGGLVCPGGTNQVGGLNADIAGCGLELCDDRYNKETIGECALHCLTNVECDSFTWELFGNTNVCTIYDGSIPNQNWGYQILCKPYPAKSYYLTDSKHFQNIIAGDNADNNVYHQPHHDRNNAKWIFTEAGDGYFYICDEKHLLCLVAGDNYDGKIYHQAHHWRDNAKWRLQPMEWGCTQANVLKLGCNYQLFDKKHGRAIVAGDNFDGRLYHQYPGWRNNARWVFGSTVTIIDVPSPPQFTNMNGYWAIVASVGGSQAISTSITTGITATTGSQLTETFTKSLSIAVEIGFEFTFGASGSITVTGSRSQSTANTISQSLSQTKTKEITVTCPASVHYLHQFVVKSDQAVVETNEFICSNIRYPQCGPGFFSCPNDPNCNTCTTAWTSQL